MRCCCCRCCCCVCNATLLITACAYSSYGPARRVLISAHLHSSSSSLIGRRSQRRKLSSRARAQSKSERVINAYARTQSSAISPEQCTRVSHANMTTCKPQRHFINRIHLRRVCIAIVSRARTLANSCIYAPLTTHSRRQTVLLKWTARAR